MNKNSEQNRITLAIAFIAIYLTIIIGFGDKIKIPTSKFEFINDMAFLIFIVFGIMVSLTFFLYLVFTALALNFYKTKEIIFEQELSSKRIEKIRKFLYNFGVHWIFASFSYPIYYGLFMTFKKSHSFWMAMVLLLLCLIPIFILFSIIFRNGKIKNKN